MERNKGYLVEPTQELWIEGVTVRALFYEKEHHPLRIKNDLRAPVEDSRAAAPHSSPPKAVRGRGQPRDKPPSPIQKNFSLLFEMCKSQHVVDVRAQYERRERRKITKLVKEIRTHLNLQSPSSPTCHSVILHARDKTTGRRRVSLFLTPPPSSPVVAVRRQAERGRRRRDCRAGRRLLPLSSE
jgi:hypothetical protein